MHIAGLPNSSFGRKGGKKGGGEDNNEREKGKAGREVRIGKGGRPTKSPEPCHHFFLFSNSSLQPVLELPLTITILYWSLILPIHLAPTLVILLLYHNPHTPVHFPILDFLFTLKALHSLSSLEVMLTSTPPLLRSLPLATVDTNDL